MYCQEGNMEIPATALIGMGAVLAAFVSGIFSYINLVVGKDQKTSEFRQQWIDAVRNDIAEFVSLAINLKDAARIYKKEFDNTNYPPAFNEIHKTIKDDVHKFGITLNRIKLRLNGRKDVNTINRLTEFFQMANSSEVTTTQLNIKAEALISEFQGILKNEWERVKAGEPAYRATKYVSISIISLITVIFLMYMFGYLDITNFAAIHVK